MDDSGLDSRSVCGSWVLREYGDRERAGGDGDRERAEAIRLGAGEVLRDGEVVWAEEAARTVEVVVQAGETV